MRLHSISSQSSAMCLRCHCFFTFVATISLTVLYRHLLHFGEGDFTLKTSPMPLLSDRTWIINWNIFILIYLTTNKQKLCSHYYCFSVLWRHSGQLLFLSLPLFRIHFMNYGHKMKKLLVYDYHALKVITIRCRNWGVVVKLWAGKKWNCEKIKMNVVAS